MPELLIQFVIYFVAGYLAITFGSVIIRVVALWGMAVAARLAGDKASLVLGASFLTINIPALPHRRQEDNDQKDSRETGNRETAEEAGNSGETGGETPDDAGLMTLGYSGGQHLAPRMSRQEHHELIAARNDAIGLLDRCVAYYRENQAADNGVIPRYDKIHMKPELRGAIVDSLWYSQWVVKSPNKTSVDPAYFPTCKDLMQAIIDKRARVYPMGYLERKQQFLDSAVQGLPENDRTQ